jgi:L-alanine-DL-glutamate epimerase-like enolase superfamily enzyme
MPELAREARRAVADGFTTVKLKVGFDDDFARAAVVRDAVGPGPLLRIDANGAWTRDHALRRLHELAPLGIELCEQPTPDIVGLRGETPVRIAADDMVAHDPEGALLRADVLVLKPMLLGGVLRALHLGREALKRGLQVVVTTSLEGAIGRAGAAHLAAAFGDQPAAGLATGRLLEGDLCEDLLAPRGGSVHIPDMPGLGL